MAKKKKGIIGKIVDQIDEKLEKKSKEKTCCCCCDKSGKKKC